VNFGIPAPGFRLPAGTHIGRVTIQVSNLERSLAYYRDLLLFTEIARGEWPHGPTATLGAADGHVLVELRERAGVRPVPRRGRLGLYHFAVLLPSRPDLGRFLAHLQHHHVPYGAADHLVSEALYLVDPDGITMEVYRDRPRAEWAVAGRELAMASDPLDARGLVEAGGDEPFTGLATGTTMGHVHFYVDDLAGAAEFYHRGLGFDQIVWTFPGALFVSAGGYHHHVGLNIWAAGAPTATDDDSKLIDWELVLPDQAAADGALASLREIGATTTGNRAADPWGIRVTLIASGAPPAR
jgi:catechol 2,3-dioxygenase